MSKKEITDQMQEAWNVFSRKCTEIGQPLKTDEEKFDFVTACIVLGIDFFSSTLVYGAMALPTEARKAFLQTTMETLNNSIKEKEMDAIETASLQKMVKEMLKVVKDEEND